MNTTRFSTDFSGLGPRGFPSARRFRRKSICPICGGGDDMPRGKGLRCFGYLASDGLYAHCSRIPVGTQENGGTWAHRLGRGCNCGARHEEALLPPPPTPVRGHQVTRDVPRIWSGLPLQDPPGTEYLQDRGLWDDGLPGAGFFRFNTGTSCDQWVNARAEEGYRCAFAARRIDGTIQTIILRHVGGGISGFGKAPTLPGCSTAGAAICRPEIRLLLEGETEFENDEIALVEGPTTFLAVTLLRDVLYRDRKARPSWTLGCVGAGMAADVVEAFGPIIAGRVLRIALDPDEAGERNARLAADAAYSVGAKRVLRWKPRDPKLDVADLLRRLA